ncbi:hypothetical protein AB0O01_16255 [Streptomyces sp. NPDC093252]|uniref:hypothetical protein n=1 Tax=Streptomyces sp. NPDC093252 TaxID=3154980 RepID=UPI0034262733
MFTAVRQHFDDLHTNETAPVILGRRANESEGGEPVRLTAAEAYEALYGPDRDPRLSATVWDAVLSTARADRSPDGTGKLLLIWLAAPRLTGTVRRICGRLRVDRSDVESEMVLALLEALEEQAGQEEAARSAHWGAMTGLAVGPLLRAARTRAWRFARAGLRETPSTQVERLSEDRALTPAAADTAEIDTARDGLDVRVDRPDGPDGLRASLRFRVRPEQLRAEALTPTQEEAGARPPQGHVPRRRVPRRRVRTLASRPVTRRP